MNFFSRRKWRAWLAKNHRLYSEVWLVYDRQLFQTRAISYRDFLGDAVEEAICYGWIDSRVKRLSESRLGVRFTPRRSPGNWSRYNRVRALKLIQNGKMTKAGTDVLPPEWTKEKLDRYRTQRRTIEGLVAGILMKRREFLVEKRRDDKDVDPGYIEIPGGHVEKDETLEDALRREMKEELGINVEKAKLVQRSLYTFGDFWDFTTHTTIDRLASCETRQWQAASPQVRANREAPEFTEDICLEGCW